MTRRELVASDGAKIAYWTSGPRRPGRGRPDQRGPDRGPSDRALLLLHGAASNHTRWSELVENTSLKARWRILQPDLRGNGASTHRTHQGIDVWCRDLVELFDAEGVGRAVVVGHSLGAQIGTHLAHRHPQRVAGLALIDPVFREALRGKQGFLARNEWIVAGAANVISGLNRLGIRRRQIPGRDLRELDEATREAMAAGDSLEVIADRYSGLGLILKHMPTSNYLRQMLATGADPPPLEEIRCPVLVLMSAKISFADTEVTRKRLGQLADLEIVPVAANHWPLTEAPDETREAIESWIEARF